MSRRLTRDEIKTVLNRWIEHTQGVVVALSDEELKKLVESAPDGVVFKIKEIANVRIGLLADALEELDGKDCENGCAAPITHLHIDYDGWVRGVCLECTQHSNQEPMNEETTREHSIYGPFAMFVADYVLLNDAERLQRIKAYLHTMMSTEDTDYRHAVLLIAAFFEGTDPNRLAEFCGYSLEFVMEVAERMVASGSWTDMGVDQEFLWAESDVQFISSFALELEVATGKFVRTTEKNEMGHYIYRLMDGNETSA